MLGILNSDINFWACNVNSILNYFCLQTDLIRCQKVDVWLHKTNFKGINKKNMMQRWDRMGTPLYWSLASSAMLGTWSAWSNLQHAALPPNFLCIVWKLVRVKRHSLNFEVGMACCVFFAFHASFLILTLTQ